MCGIYGIAAGGGHRVGVTDAQVARLRELLVHRGPDDAGLWRSGTGQFVLGHRRLAVLDPSPRWGSSQPIVLPRGGVGEGSGAGAAWAVAYNGELYNDSELRGELKRGGASVRFESSCDTETVAQALAVWGTEAIRKFRGMFALAAVDVRAKRLVLARDPLGIKPLYYWVGACGDGAGGGGGLQVVFASEPAAVVAHPDVGARPDLVTVSAYLTTIRTVLGERTLFEGVRALLPGEVIEFDLSEGRSAGQVTRTRHTAAAGGTHRGGEDVRATIVDSVMRHLRSDVPACSLLSGGLDSSIIAAVMRRGLGAGAEIRTYASGFDDGTEETDLGFARRVAGELKTVHTAAPVTREMFAERWRGMIDRMGTPLSTPNEVAINEVARRLRADGQVVALSGEGADELFAGYELPMMQAWEFERGRTQRGSEASRHQGEDGGLFQLRSNSWIAPEAKAVVLRPEVWRGVEHDAALRAWYSSEFAAIREVSEGVQTHLSFHRRVNLTGLLQRLDTATMLEGVEGRTPFADVVVAGLADRLPMEQKFVPGDGTEAGRARTKIALREAFVDWLPREVVERPKASFPLPFQQWLVDHTRSLRESALAKAMFGEAAVESVCADPGRMWSLAWPMINVAMWGERWWGE